MSRKFSRLVLVAFVAAGFGVVPMLDAYAAGQERGLDVFDMPRGFETTADTPHKMQIDKGDTVIWHIQEGTHTITPADTKMWDGDEESGSEELQAGTDYAVTFNRVGKLNYYCKLHGSSPSKGVVEGMSGQIEVRDPTATTTTTTPPVTSPPATQPPATTTTHPAAPGVTVTTAPAPASSSGTHTPSSAGQAQTTTTAKDKGKKHKDEETTTTTTAPAPPPPVELPDSAIIPALPGSGTTTVQDGAIGDPLSAPEGEAVALLKPSKRSGNGLKLLIVSGVGLGALGIGTAGYKFANRSSKYFPA